MPGLRSLAPLAAILFSLPGFSAVRSGQTLAEGWHIRQLDTDTPDIAQLTREAAAPDKSWWSARMPEQVHEVLLRNGVIPDPHVGRNNAKAAFVGQKNWAYSCVFPSPKAGSGPVFLRFGGLDTLATAYLNGTRIGSFENMYREYAVDVTTDLAPAGRRNVLLLIFSSPLNYIEKVQQRPEDVRVIARHKYVRKAYNDFNTYFGWQPNSVKMGVYRDVVLDVRGASWLADVWVRPRLAPDFRSAVLHVRVEAGGSRASLRWVLHDPAGREVDSGTMPVAANAATFEIPVRNPELWWPRTHGPAKLYRLQVDLLDGAQVLDSRAMQVGIRDVKPVLVDPATGEKRFRFDINGKPVFLQGANWAPLEGMTHCWQPERAKRLLDLVEHGRMNILRLWGQGVIPPPEFYDECDRRGIFVWQDFMFGFGMHPTDHPGFRENVRAEIEGMIRQLRNHASILLWVGGNENHMGYDFVFGGKSPVGLDLFEKIMPEACGRLDPDRIFHGSSPYGGNSPNWPLEGDWHDYTTLTFSPQASVPLFASEIGRASAPSAKNMRRYLPEEEIWPKGFNFSLRKPGQLPWPAAWGGTGVWDKVGPVEQYPDPASPEDLVRVLGTAHGEYLRQRVDRQRRGVPNGAPDGSRRCWGNMIWRLNDPWPQVYWSVVDYWLEPKIPYYFLRRAYDPVLVSFEQTPERIAVWVANDSPEETAGGLVVRRMRFDGKVRGELTAEVRVAPGQSKRCLDLTAFGPISLREEFLHAAFQGHESTHLLIGERYLRLPPAKLDVRPVNGKLEIGTDAFARGVAIEVDGDGTVLEDNFFDLPPGQRRSVGIVDRRGGTQVTVRALNAEPVKVTLRHP
jgi:hypothetical protein